MSGRIRIPIVVEAIPISDLINETTTAFRTHPTVPARRHLTDVDTGRTRTPRDQRRSRS